MTGTEPAACGPPVLPRTTEGVTELDGGGPAIVYRLAHHNSSRRSGMRATGDRRHWNWDRQWVNGSPSCWCGTAVGQSVEDATFRHVQAGRDRRHSGHGGR